VRIDELFKLKIHISNKKLLTSNPRNEGDPAGPGGPEIVGF
jgi:hypothetical protein